MNLKMRWNHFWFEQVPTHRITLFRTAIALTSLKFFIRHATQRMIQYDITSSFHDSMLPGIPHLTPHIGKLLIFAQYSAAWALLLGIFSQCCAGFLAISGLYVFLLEKSNYLHWYQFHTVLLFLLSFSKNQPSIMRWIRPNTHSALTSSAWPEHLIRFQLSIVLFYAGLNKICNPYWGFSGNFFPIQFGDLFIFNPHHLNSAFQKWVISLLLQHAGAASIAVITIEIGLAIGLLFRRFWRSVLPVTFIFALNLELLMHPAAFAWDFMAVLLLFI